MNGSKTGTDSSRVLRRNRADMPLYFRSRMTGTLGLCFRTGEFDTPDLVQMMREIEIYKETRLSRRAAAAAPLTAQADTAPGTPWDVLETIPVGNREVLLSAFQADESQSSITITPINLRPSTTYEVLSVDVGALGRATGAELMSDGIAILGSPFSAAHLIILRPQRRGG